MQIDEKNEDEEDNPKEEEDFDVNGNKLEAIVISFDQHGNAIIAKDD